MPSRHPPLPDLWLVSDARNDAVLEAALARLPRGSGFIFRHYHLRPPKRAPASICWRGLRGMAIASSCPAPSRCPADGALTTAREWGAPRRLRLAATRSPPARASLAPRHRPFAARDRPGRTARAPTRSALAGLPHPFAPRRAPLGPVRFRLLAAHARDAGDRARRDERARRRRLGSRMGRDGRHSDGSCCAVTTSVVTLAISASPTTRDSSGGWESASAGSKHWFRIDT